MNVKRLAPLIVLAALGAGCADPPAAVTTLPAASGSLSPARGEFRDVLYLTGEVESAGGETIVVPRIPNWQTSIKTLVKDGTRVEAGDVVAELDSTQFSSGLESRRQGLTDAVQQIAQQIARNEADLTQKTFDLEQKRVALEKARTNARIPKEIVPLRDWEEYQLALKRAQAEHEKALTDLESERKSGEAELANLRLTKAGAERDIQVAEAAIEALTLTAGIPGVVVIGENPRSGRKFQTGDTVWVGMKLASIPDLSRLGVKANMIDVDDGRVEPGMPVEVVVDAFPERTFRGSVESIGTVAETMSRESLRRRFVLSIVLEDADRDLLRPGYSVRAAVERTHLRDALLVPRVAVDFSSAEPIVRKHNGKILENVKFGDCNARECVVLSGLDESERLAAAGAEDS